MGEFAIVSRISNNVIIIDTYDNYKGVTQDGDSVVLHNAGEDTVYAECFLVKIR